MTSIVVVVEYWMPNKSLRIVQNMNEYTVSIENDNYINSKKFMKLSSAMEFYEKMVDRLFT